MKRRKKNTKKESEYLAEILERICAKPRLGSHGQLSTGFPTGLLPAHSSHQEDGSFQPGFGSKREKKKRKIGVCFVYPGLYQGVPPSMVPQAHSCAVTAGCRRHCRCGFSGGQMSMVMVRGWFFFSFFLCIESAFRKLALHFLHPEVINYLY